MRARLVITGLVLPISIALLAASSPSDWLPAKVSGWLIALRDAVTFDPPDPTAPPGTGTLVVGDSHVRRAPFFGPSNLGVNGDTVDDVRERLPALVATAPRRIVLMVGTNDLLRGATPTETAEKLERLLSDVPPNIEIVTIGVPPMDDRRQRRIPDPETIASLNRRLADMGPRFVDLSARLQAPDGRVNDRYTSDGIHLSPAGYDAVRADLIALLR